MSADKQRIVLVIAWLWVGVPLLYGLVELVRKATALFSG
ncbi:MFS transporter small subunit [Umezawaea beigongshangensis]